jgi:hypothetical protein
MHWRGGAPSGTIAASVSRQLDSVTLSAPRAALSGYAYAYAYPFAWRFS